MKKLVAGISLLLVQFSTLSFAVEVGPCGYLDRISFLEGNPRTFANGAITVAVADTFGEPVCCSSHLLVFIPSPEIGSQCFAISQEAAKDESSPRGFMSVDINGIRGAYDARKGLLLNVPYRLYEDTGKGIPGMTGVRINLKGEGAVKIEE
jgi:hypothetical protein